MCMGVCVSCRARPMCAWVCVSCRARPMCAWVGGVSECMGVCVV